MKELDVSDIGIAVGLSLLLSQILDANKELTPAPTPLPPSDPLGAAAAAQLAATLANRLDILGAIGLAGAGPIALLGANVGARVAGVLESGNSVVSADFEGVISVNDQIQQLANAHISALVFFLQGP